MTDKETIDKIHESLIQSADRVTLALYDIYKATQDVPGLPGLHGMASEALHEFHSVVGQIHPIIALWRRAEDKKETE